MSEWYLVVLVVAVVGGLIGIKLKLPASAMLGSMIAVGIFTVATGLQVTPPWIKVAAQMVSGGYIGTTMTRDSLSQMKKMAPVAVMLLAGMLVINLVVGGILYLTSPLDLCTSLFATAPGGLTDMTIISDDLGANSAVVSVFQVVRMSSAIMIFPLIIPPLCGVKREKAEKKPEAAKTKKVKKPMTREQKINLAKTICVAFVSGLLGYLSGIPAGTMTFSVLGVSFTKIKYNIGYIPMNVKRGAQMLSGSFIGAKITMDTVRLIISMWPNVLILLVTFIPACLLLGWLLYRTGKIDLTTALFCSAPAGASDMALIASEVGADGPNVAVLQIIRMLGVIALFPPIFKFIIGVFAA